MQNQVDGNFKFIGHIVDHFSRYRYFFPMVSKTAAETAENCIRFFSIFGLPNIIQSDNGSEFVNDVLRAVTVLWPGKSRFINGSVGHSQSQGMVEQGNHTLRTMIAARTLQEKTSEWVKWLPEFQCKFILRIYVYTYICVLFYGVYMKRSSSLCLWTY